MSTAKADSNRTNKNGQIIATYSVKKILIKEEWYSDRHPILLIVTMKALS